MMNSGQFLRLVLLAVMLHAPLALRAMEATVAERPVATIDRDGGTLRIDVTMTVPVPPATAWEVLTDFDHMTEFLPGLELSQSEAQSPNIFLVKQKGRSAHGLFSFEFDSIRRVELHPISRIDAHNVSGNLGKVASIATLTPVPGGVRVHYHADAEASIWIRLFGQSAMRGEAEERFEALATEMKRRHAKP